MSNPEAEGEAGTMKDTSNTGIEKEDLCEMDKTHFLDNDSAQSDCTEKRITDVNPSPEKEAVQSDGTENLATAVNLTPGEDSAQFDGVENHMNAENSTPEKDSAESAGIESQVNAANLTTEKVSAQSDGTESHMNAANSTPEKDSAQADGIESNMNAVSSTPAKDSCQSDGIKQHMSSVNSTPEENPDPSENEGPKSSQDGIVGDECDAETGELQEDMKKADGENLPVESDSLVNKEELLDAQTDDKMAQELQHGVTEKELDPETEIHVATLENGDMRKESPTEDEEDDDTSSSEDSGMELCPEEDLMDEVDDETPEMDLPQDGETRGEELVSMGTESDLPSDNELREEADNTVNGMAMLVDNNITEEQQPEFSAGNAAEVKRSSNLFLLGADATEDEETGTEEEQLAFMKELETFHKEKFLEFKPPRFYGEPLNCLKLWRAVIRLGGYEQVTSCKYWRQVGESFKPPKTCTTVSWTFRCFYEKALLEYEKHKMLCGELPFGDASLSGPTSGGTQPGMHQALGTGRARRDAAARAMQGWHSQRNLGNGEVGDAVIKDKNSTSTPKREKTLKNIGLLKRKRPSPVDPAIKAARLKVSKPQSDTMVVDVGPPADWVKINVQRTKDCFELYALVPGLLREEVRVQSDPAGRLVITGQPEQLENPWGVTPFKKVVTLPSRIDPHQTSAVVTLHGQLFVRIPYEQPDM